MNESYVCMSFQRYTDLRHPIFYHELEYNDNLVVTFQVSMCFLIFKCKTRGEESWDG